MSSTNTSEKIHDAEVVAPADTNGKKKKGSQALAKRGATAIAPLETAPPRVAIEDMIMRAMEMDKPELIDKLVSIFEKREAERKAAAFFDALAAFQAECPVIKKSKSVLNKGGATIRYHYADLGGIVKQVAPLLAKHGLSYDFTAHPIAFTEEGGGPYMEVVCRAHHRDGHTQETPFLSLIENNDFMNATQHAGSANSYAKRYAFTNAFGILTAEDDDDGQTAGKGIVPAEARKTQSQRAPITQPRAKGNNQPDGEILPLDQRPQIQPVSESESGNGIDKATATGFKKAMVHAWKEYGDQAEKIANDEFRKRFPNIERFSQIPDTAAAKKIILSWLADPIRN